MESKKFKLLLLSGFSSTCDEVLMIFFNENNTDHTVVKHTKTNIAITGMEQGKISLPRNISNKLDHSPTYVI